MALKAPVPGTKVFELFVLPVLLYGCETWTLPAALNSRLDSFGTKSLRWILGYRWFDFVSNDRLLKETYITKTSKLFFERQMSMIGHVARLPPRTLLTESFLVATLRGGVVVEGLLPRGQDRRRGNVAGLGLTGCGPKLSPRRMLRFTGECGGAEAPAPRCKP